MALAACRGGASNRPLLGCVYLPDIDHQSAAITLKIENTDIQIPVDPSPDGHHVVLQLDGTGIIESPTFLVIESRARGSLSLANLIQKYQVSP